MKLAFALSQSNSGSVRADQAAVTLGNHAPRAMRCNAESRIGDPLAMVCNRSSEGRPVGHARSIGPAGKLWRWCRRKPVLAGMTAGIVTLLLTVTAVSVAAAWRIASTAKVWDANTGNELLTVPMDPVNGYALMGLSNIVRWVEFDPKVERLLTGSSDGKVRIWNVVTGQLMATFVAGEPGWGVVKGHFLPDRTAAADPARRGRVPDSVLDQPELQRPGLHRSGDLGDRGHRYKPDGNPGVQRCRGGATRQSVLSGRGGVNLRLPNSTPLLFQIVPADPGRFLLAIHGQPWCSRGRNPDRSAEATHHS